MRRSRLALLAALLAALVAGGVIAPVGRAATPASGEVSATNPSVTWSGGPFLAINPTTSTGCPVGQEPYCDSFALVIGELSADRPDVLVLLEADRQNGGLTSDLYYAAIYGPDGQEVAAADGLGPRHRLTLETPVPGTYSVRMELMLGVPGVSTYKGSAVATDAGAPIDAETECGVVEDQSVLLTPDDGRQVSLDILVLLDGVSQAFAEDFFQDVAIPYAEINVAITPTFVVADPPFEADEDGRVESTDMIAQARQRFPQGKVPAEFDVVEVLTAKDLTLAGQSAVAGQAACIGGLAFDEWSFEVSEAGEGFEPVVAGPFTFVDRFAAKVTSHELGHLLGGQHHYANCVEGNNPDEELNGDTSPCTLMANLADLVSLDFSAINAAIARGYAITHASANDADDPPANQSPTAADDSARVQRNRSVVVPVLSNDTDPDGDPLTIESVGAPSNGTVAIVDGGVEYTPRRGFGGEDTFTYVVSDGRGGTAAATVRVSVTAAPPR